MKSAVRIALSLTTSALLLGACTSDSADAPNGDGDSSDTGDVLDASPLAVCKSDADFKTTTGLLKCTPCGNVLADRSGRGFLPAFIADDPLMVKVYRTFVDKNKNKKIDAAEIDCPIEMPDIMAKLKKTDPDPGIGCLTLTRVVSETAARLGKDKADYRAVTSRGCGRPDFSLLFSSFGFTGRPEAKGSGVHIEEKGHPGEIEIIAFDETAGVFNFYKEVGGAMRFFGSSIDFVVAGPGGPGLTNTRGCANCHPGGGLNMKELQSPWTHWALQDDIQGADTLVKSREEYMGRLDPGADMEFDVTEPGNETWNGTKAEFFRSVTTAQLKKARAALADDKLPPAQLADMQRRQLRKGLNATQALLEPLFCSVQVNINAPGKFGVPPQLFAANRNIVLFPGFFPADFDKAFDAALAAINSLVPGVPGAHELTTEFMVVERSHEDADYVDRLVSLGVIDQEFMRDVLMVDFTRPVFSDDRCNLLSLVPDLAPAERTPTKLRDAIIDSLRKAKVADGTPGGLLLAHLEARKAGKPFNHDATMRLYGEACNRRSAAEMARDGLKLRSLQRKLVYRFDGALDSAAGTGFHPFAVFEFEPTMPADDIAVTTSAEPDSATQVHPDARFNPIDCLLTSKFVATGTSEAPGPDSACAPRTGNEKCSFRQGATCQCDSQCMQFDNCCSDFQDVCLANPPPPM